MKTQHSSCQVPLGNSSNTNRKPFLMLLGIALTLLWPGQLLRAAILNNTFTGNVVSVADAGFLLNDSITVGTPIHGFYIFDSSTPDSNTDPTVGDYYHTNSDAGIVVKVGDYVFRTDPAHVNFLIEAVNRTSDDDIVIRSYNNVCSRALVVEHISWQLSDYSGAALTNAALPIIPPNLQEFSQDFGLTVSGGYGTKFYTVRAVVTNITAAPVAVPQRPVTTVKDAVELSWPSALGYFYQTQMSTDMVNWTNVGDPILGDGGVISKFVSKLQGANAYFRAEIANHP